MKTGKPIAVGIGELLWDRFPEGDRLGGAPANFAFHAAQLGFEARIVSRLGKDKDGQKIRDVFRSLGLSSDLLQEDGFHPTGLVKVRLENGQPGYEIATPAAWDFLSFNEALREIAKNLEVVCFGTLAQRNPVSEKSIRRFIECCSNQAIRLFDINLRQNYYSHEVIDFGLNHASVLKLNHEEMEVLGRLFGWEKEKVRRQLFGRYPLKWIAITLGAGGCEIHSRQESVRASAPAIVFQDAVGAGDAFGAALVMGLKDLLPLEEVASLANQAGSFVASQAGATPIFPPDLLRRAA